MIITCLEHTSPKQGVASLAIPCPSTTRHRVVVCRSNSLRPIYVSKKIKKIKKRLMTCRLVQLLAIPRRVS